MILNYGKPVLVFKAIEIFNPVMVMYTAKLIQIVDGTPLRKEFWLFMFNEPGLCIYFANVVFRLPNAGNYPFWTFEHFL